jgi:hypothetical protein
MGGGGSKCEATQQRKQQGEGAPAQVEGGEAGTEPGETGRGPGESWRAVDSVTRRRCCPLPAAARSGDESGKAAPASSRAEQRRVRLVLYVPLINNVGWVKTRWWWSASSETTTLTSRVGLCFHTFSTAKSCLMALCR